MEKHIHTMARIGVSALAIMAMAPTAALAEEERSGIPGASWRSQRRVLGGVVCWVS